MSDVSTDVGPLIFLLGSQRSGTTWLHLQLARSGRFRFVSAADVCEGEELAVGTRGIDSIPAGPDTPEEYGLIINAGGLRYDDPDTTEATLPRLRALIARKAEREGRDRPLLLKSPPDYPGGIGLLRTAFPDAHFVAIQRHPLRTLQSQVRAWRQLVMERQPYLDQVDRGYRAFMDDQKRRLQLGLLMHSRAGIVRLADSILRAQLGFMALQDTWPGDNILTIRYEDLCADQDGGFARLATFLGMDLPAPADAPAPRDEPITADVAEVFEERRLAFAPFLHRFGYESAS
ncbi:MAG: sulfotransferase [Gemmatimonadota bacterium]